ncbi:hypothetical protein EDC21_11822 [Thermohydrogenium kirishiense]|nr:hypothetical protein EDC21_11822 [Thermohydrogenium kirishiense]
MTKSILETINNKIKELQKNLILLKSVAQDVNEENIKGWINNKVKFRRSVEFNK